MRRIVACGAGALALMVGNAVAESPATALSTLVPAAEMKWGEAPPVFEKGASFTVVSGDPARAGIIVARLKLPAGYRIAPHTHPFEERVTVLSGTLALGDGDTFDKAALKQLKAGGYAVLPADRPHYARATTATTIQIDCTGPFALTYVDPKDDPSKR